MGFLPWEICVSFPRKSQLWQRRTTQPTVHAGCFSVLIIHQTLAWTTEFLTWARMLMHAIANGGVWTPLESLHWNLTLAKKSRISWVCSRVLNRCSTGPSMWSTFNLPTCSPPVWVSAEDACCLLLDGAVPESESELLLEARCAGVTRPVWLCRYAANSSVMDSRLVPASPAQCKNADRLTSL